VTPKPDVAVVLIGGNDKVQSDADRARTLANLEEIARRISGCGTRLLMLQYHPSMPAPENAHKAWRLDDKNDLIARAAASVGAPVLSLAPAMRAAAEKHQRSELVNAVDGVHLNPRGEIVFARAIFQKLDELGWIDVP
jgi:lysophospholipase L1-like esterase